MLIALFGIGILHTYEVDKRVSLSMPNIQLSTLAAETSAFFFHQRFTVA
jgi:hypothetical protein